MTSEWGGSVESADPHPLLPSLRLDELLDELQVRLQAVLSTRDRVYSLLEAVVAVGSSLDLEVLLRSIVETAVSLVDAQYGAMGVVGEGGRLADFIPVGLDAEQVAGIDHWPQGKGVLGQLITDPKPLRLADISEHHNSFGFPAGHPPMKSFVGVPIRIRDEVYGNLYLTEKRGGGQFDAEDETMLVALAAAAGVAIDNARLYEEARRQQRWLSATAEVTRHLLSGAGLSEALSMITDKALEMTDADLVMVTLPMADGSHVRVEHAAGAGAEQARGLVSPLANSVTETVIRSGERLSIADYPSDDRVAGTVKASLPIGPLEAVPLGGAGNVRGVLSAGRRKGAMPLSPAAADMLATFAAQAAIALELAEHRRQAERMAVFEDRDRIAKDLHDLVIQQLYATGMSLQGVTSLITSREVAERVSRSVDALDDTIKEIRSAIFALQTDAAAQPGDIRARILFVVQDMAQALGFAPSLHLQGALDAKIPEEVIEQMLTALRESLANVARHASASQVTVTVSVSDELVLTVKDDGVGIKPGGRRSGLRNLHQRAAALGGSLSVRSPGGEGTADEGTSEGGGTELVWRVPLPETAAR
ncbi:MAG: GAF domain-containing protein [Nocardiopsaceae bacterium]|nr:GAF domain-containing protein [Nocardiopsaceae bacterium]